MLSLPRDTAGREGRKNTTKKGESRERNAAKEEKREKKLFKNISLRYPGKCTSASGVSTLCVSKRVFIGSTGGVFTPSFTSGYTISYREKWLDTHSSQ